nr:unnamed protein product [Callosobruchus analis]
MLSDILKASESNRAFIDAYGWVFDNKKDVGIKIMNNNIRLLFFSNAELGVFELKLSELKEGIQYEDRKGEINTSWVAELGLIAIQDGKHTTFVREIRGVSIKQVEKNLRQAIKLSNLECQRKLVTEVHEDIWEKGYRITRICNFTGRINVARNAAGKEENCSGTFPSPSKKDQRCSAVSRFTRDELMLATEQLRLGNLQVLMVFLQK